MRVAASQATSQSGLVRHEDAHPRALADPARQQPARQLGRLPLRLGVGQAPVSAHDQLPLPEALRERVDQDRNRRGEIREGHPRRGYHSEVPALEIDELRVDADSVLRAVRDDDAEPLFALVDAHRAYLREWLPWVDANSEVAYTRRFIERSRDQKQKGEGWVGVVLSAGEHCGVAGYNSVDWDNRTCTIGYWLRADRQGRGLATGSCRALVRAAFNVLDLNSVRISAATKNWRSRAIPERLGFMMDGVLRDAEWLYDHFVDHAFYTLLRSEWKDAS